MRNGERKWKKNGGMEMRMRNKIILDSSVLAFSDCGEIMKMAQMAREMGERKVVEYTDDSGIQFRATMADRLTGNVFIAIVRDEETGRIKRKDGVE